MNSLVSICIPAYNAEKYIERCIKSVLDQSYSHFEIVVVDDASTDDTAKIIKAFNDNRIKYFLNDVNLGWRKNVKRCYELAQGEFVTILPVDDFLDAEFIQNAINSFSVNEKLGIWACSSYAVDEKFNTISYHIRPLLGLIKAYDYFKYTYTLEDVSPPAETMLRKRCIDLSNGYECYDSKYKQFPEIKLYLQISKLGFNAFHTDKKLCYRTIRKDSLTGMYGKKAFIHNDNFNIFFEFYSDDLINKITRKKAIENITRQISNDIIYNLKHLKINEVLLLHKLLKKNKGIIKKMGYERGFLFSDSVVYIIKRFLKVLKRKLSYVYNPK